jgi:glutamate synthase (NADPH/NADH) small chain
MEQIDINWRRDLRRSVPAKERSSIDRVEMPVADARERIKGNEEVNKGLTVEMAMAEARRCLDCPKPHLHEGCPVNINIPSFIKNIETGNFAESVRIIKQNNLLPAICGRVCPQETQCEAKCIYHDKMNKKPVAIGYLERFVADWERNSGNVSMPEISGRKTKRLRLLVPVLQDLQQQAIL